MVGTVGTVPMYRTHRTHYTYPVSNRSSNRSFKLKNMFLYNKLLINFKDIKKSLARSAANWVRMVGTVGTVHGYGTWVRWVRWYGRWIPYMGTVARYMGTVHGYGTWVRCRHPNIYPTPVPAPNNSIPKTNSRNRTQQYPTPVPVPNTCTQHPYPTPVPVPNTRTHTRTYRNDPPYPYVAAQ